MDDPIITAHCSVFFCCEYRWCAIKTRENDSFVWSHGVGVGEQSRCSRLDDWLFVYMPFCQYVYLSKTLEFYF